MELASIAQAVMRSGGPEPRNAGERIVVSPRLLLPLLAGETRGSELLRDLRGAMATNGERSVTLILPANAAPEGQATRVDVGGRLFVIPPTLRDAVLARLATPAPLAAAAPPPLVAEEGAARAWATAASAQVAASQTPALAAQATLAVPASGAAREVLRALVGGQLADDRDPATPRVGLRRPLLEQPAPLPEVGPVQPIGEVAQSLRREVERSGLFLESHVAQWARGDRSSDDLRAELVHLTLAAGSMQAVAEGVPQRVAAQLRLMQEPAFLLQGLAWPGQPFLALIAQEPPPKDSAPGLPPVFSARIEMDLPSLGVIVVRLRLAGDAVSAVLAANEPTRITAGLSDLTEGLRSCGLQPVAVLVEAPEVAA